ncbi:MAG: hypothetical protein PCFJNLEI_02334 [Verrucomicrobiae bacterium]|nr:hypothetical protein [Verrucomicrobiae bacterium]
MRKHTVTVVGLAVLLAGFAHADEAVDYKKLYEEQKQRNDDLEKRITLIEERGKEDLYLAKETVPETTVGFLEKVELSGFASASYFYNFNRPLDHANTGRGFDVKHNEFMINKAVLTLEKPVEYNAFDWQAGFAAQLVFGQDVEYMQASGLDLGSNGDLFLANVTLNIPIGNGLKVTFGKYGTMLGYEASLTENNYNWSGGNQWTLIEPFTHTGLALAYKISDEAEVQLLINNGWDNVTDDNGSKSFMGYFNYAPNDNTSFTLVGYGGPEANNDSDWRRDAEIIVSHKLTPHLTGVVQLDYGTESGARVIGTTLTTNFVDLAQTIPGSVDAEPTLGGRAEWYAAGLWLTYEKSEKWNATLRTDYLNDNDGARTSQAPYRTEFPINTGQELYSVTLTLNYKPIPEIRISPELRWDRSSLRTAFDGHRDQVTIGVGAAYFY